MLAIRPPRSRHVVRLDQPWFQGEMHHLCQLDTTPTPQLLRKLTTGDQLAVSSHGSDVAVVQIIDNAKERVRHTAFKSSLEFHRGRSGAEQGTRILEVGDDHVLVWGRTAQQPPGVWWLSPGHEQYLYPVEKIIGRVGQGSAVMNIGLSSMYPGQHCLLTPDGLWPVDRQALVNPYASGGLAVLESFGGTPHAYQLHGGLITSLQCLVDLRYEHLGIVRWRGQLVLVKTSDLGSRLTQISPITKGDKPIDLPVRGRIEQVWSSPQGNSIALLVAPRGPNSSYRRLYLDSGRLIYQGAFTLAQEDLTWSAGGRSFAALIREGAGGRVFEKIVTPTDNQDLPLGVHLKEVLVDEDGAIAGAVLTDGQHDFPEVWRSQRTTVPLAWNLHFDGDGAVVWNTVHGDRILKWVDCTGPAVRAA